MAAFNLYCSKEISWQWNFDYSKIDIIYVLTKYLTESAALLCFNIYIFNMVTIGNLVNIFYVMFMRERFILCLTRWRFWIGGDYLLMRIDQLQIKCWRCIRLLIWYRYNWNIVESDIKHHTLLLIYLLYKRLKIVYGY